MLLGDPVKPVLDCLKNHFLSPLNAQIAVTSALLSCLLPEIGNRLTSPEKAIQWNYEKYGDTLYELLGRAFNDELKVSLTLESRKVYVGLLREIPNLEPTDEYLKIMPYYSGFRDSESLMMDLRTSYKELYRIIDEAEDGKLHGLTAGDFEIVIPVKTITTASLFSEETYDEVFASKQRESRRQRPVTASRLLRTLTRWWDQRER